MKSCISIILFILVCSFATTSTIKDWKNNIFKWDKSGYHLHLPAVFIYQDITRLAFYDDIEKLYRLSEDEEDYGLYELDNGNRIDRYNIGVAVMETPFFLIAHFINTLWLNYPADGYSLPYQWGALISNLFWTVLGLFCLRRFLLVHFSDNVSAITILLIAFGTNLYYYTVFGGGMSHNYSFFLFAMVLLHTDRLYSSTSKQHFYILGITFGMIAITRSVNLIVLLVPLLWSVNNMSAIKKRLLFLKSNWLHIGMAALLFILVAMLQTGYWKYITGHWIYDGYHEEGFIWTEPAIWQGLFSFQKGWFIYTPMAVFTIWGIYSMRMQFATHIPALIVFMSVNIYVTFCWWNWWYGGGFGCRPFVEVLAILSFPLAVFISQLKQNRVIHKWIAGLLLLSLIILNMFQSYQYSKGVIHYEKMSRAYYFNAFMKTKPDKADEQYLMSNSEYYNEMARRLEKATIKREFEKGRK